MKAGQRIEVRIYPLSGPALEPAKVARVTKDMLPLPAGFVPVRFDADGARLLVHVSNIVAEVVS